MNLLLCRYQMLIEIICFVLVMSLHCPFLSKKSQVYLLIMRTKSYLFSMFFAPPPLQQWSSTMKPWHISIKVRYFLTFGTLETAGLMMYDCRCLHDRGVTCHARAFWDNVSLSPLSAHFQFMIRGYPHLYYSTPLCCSPVTRPWTACFDFLFWFPYL